MTNLSIGADTFRVEIEGDAAKPALVLSHALGTDLSLWDAQMPAFLKAFRVIRYDTRGHGGSTADGGVYSIAMLGRDVLGILDAIEIESVNFVGISMGGAIGQWLLAHAPHRIDRAVLANTSAKFGTPAGWNERIVGVLDKGMTAVADGTMERCFSPTFAEQEPEKVTAIRALIETTSPVGYAACCAALRDLDLRAALRVIDAPVLVVSGRDDQSIGDDATRHLVETIPGAKHIVLDARHLSNVEADAAFSKAVVGFLTAKIPAKAKRPASDEKRAAPARQTTVTRRVGVRRLTAARLPLVGMAKPKTKGPAPKSHPPKAKTSDIKTPKLAPKATRDAEAAPLTARAKAATAKIPPAKTKPLKGKTSKVDIKPKLSGKTSVARTAPAEKTSAKTASAKAPAATAKTAPVKVAPARKTRLAQKGAAKPVTTKRVKATAAPLISKTTKAPSSAYSVKRPSAKSLKAMAASAAPKARASKMMTSSKPLEASTPKGVKPKGKTASTPAPTKKAPTRPASIKNAKPKASTPTKASTSMKASKTASASRAPSKAAPKAKAKAGRRAS